MIETVRLNEPGARTIKEAKPLIREGAQVVVQYDRSTGDLLAYSGTKLIKVGALADASLAEILEWFLTEPQEGDVTIAYDPQTHTFSASTGGRFQATGKTAREAFTAYRRARRNNAYPKSFRRSISF